MKTIVLSDLHAGGENAWLTPSQFDAFQAFCDNVQADRIVLNGDIFDLWYFPHDVVPPTPRELLELPMPKRVVQVLSRLSERIPTVYVVGNHDDGMTADIIRDALPKVTFAGMVLSDSKGTIIEHGHRHAMFCAPDDVAEDHVPLGYAVSRLAATADKRMGGHCPTRQEMVASLIESGVEHAGIPGALLHAVAKHAGVSDNEPIKMPPNLWGGRDTTIVDIEHAYGHLIRAWGLDVASGLAAEVGDLKVAAWCVFAKGARAVVFGHTHAWEKKRYAVGCWRYLNDGCMCSDVPSCAWIDGNGCGIATPRELLRI